MRRLPIIVSLFILLPCIWMQQSACSKDYSFEGADTLALTDSLVKNDTLPVGNTNPLFCAGCKESDNLLVGQWSFKTGNALLCGGTDNSGFIGTQKTFTLFGPSTCSIDTGLVMTVYMDQEMNKNIFNVSTSRVAFYYYDHFGTQDIFISRSSSLFTVNITSYYVASRLATGTFQGTVFRPNGDSVYIKEGKFKVYLK